MNEKLFLILPLLLSGCVNNFEKFYTSAPINPNITLCPYSGSTKINASNDLNGDGVELRKDGYAPLGVALFEAGGANFMGQLNDRAKELGADIVLYSDKYLGSQQSSLMLPDVSTTNTVGSVGGVSYRETSSTTGTQVVPITIRRYAWTATFWRKAQSYIFGVFVSNLPDDLRQKLQRNGGVLIRIVVVESPAFKANILPGDVLIRINEQDVYSAEQYARVIGMERGKSSIVTLIRNGETKSIPVAMNP